MFNRPSATDKVSSPTPFVPAGVSGVIGLPLGKLAMNLPKTTGGFAFFLASAGAAIVPKAHSNTASPSVILTLLILLSSSLSPGRLRTALDAAQPHTSCPPVVAGLPSV